MQFERLDDSGTLPMTVRFEEVELGIPDQASACIPFDFQRFERFSSRRRDQELGVALNVPAISSNRQQFPASPPERPITPAARS
jgi:hypothetical protein